MRISDERLKEIRTIGEHMTIIALVDEAERLVKGLNRASGQKCQFEQAISELLAEVERLRKIETAAAKAGPRYALLASESYDVEASGSLRDALGGNS